MEQMVASSEGIVRDGELGIRCTLTEPAVQGVPGKKRAATGNWQKLREVQERESV